MASRLSETTIHLLRLAGNITKHAGTGCSSKKTCIAAIVFGCRAVAGGLVTSAGMQRGSATAGGHLLSSSRAPQVSVAAPAAAAGRSGRAGLGRGPLASSVHRLPGSQGSRESQQSPGASDAVHSNSGEEANEDEPSESEQLSGAAHGMSLQERIRGDKTNYNSHQSR